MPAERKDGQLMTQLKAIGAFCRECAGDNARAVTLCTGLHCSLWPYRLGCTMKSNVYAKRVRKTWAAGGYDVEEVRRIGFTEAHYLQKPSKSLSKIVRETNSLGDEAIDGHLPEKTQGRGSAGKPAKVADYDTNGGAGGESA